MDYMTMSAGYSHNVKLGLTKGKKRSILEVSMGKEDNMAKDYEMTEEEKQELIDEKIKQDSKEE